MNMSRLLHIAINRRHELGLRDSLDPPRSAGRQTVPTATNPHNLGRFDHPHQEVVDGIPAAEARDLEDGRDQHAVRNSGAGRPESLTCRKLAANHHKGGRRQIGMVADFKSESRPASRRYTRPD
jgi:hypothetical protein